MRQAAFEDRYQAAWDAFGRWLDHPATRSSNRRSTGAPPFDDREFPARYRAICQHLALARDRHYSPDLVDRLNQLALRGHHLLYGARADRRSAVVEFLFESFPRTVREEWRYVAVASLLFFGPLLALVFLVERMPQAVYYLLEPNQMAQLQEMYSNASQRSLGRRGAETDLSMFGFYIWNNVKIGFQSFATGIAFGLGTVFYLVYNGVFIGATAGFLASVGLGNNFWTFVAGHSGMELTAIALSGGAGLRLGMALIAPGQRSRRLALIEAAQPAIRIVFGAATMFLIAAFIEGFWSPHAYLPSNAKIALGIALWLAILAYLGLAGRARRALGGAAHAN